SARASCRRACSTPCARHRRAHGSCCAVPCSTCLSFSPCWCSRALASRTARALTPGPSPLTISRDLTNAAAMDQERGLFHETDLHLLGNHEILPALLPAL